MENAILNKIKFIALSLVAALLICTILTYFAPSWVTFGAQTSEIDVLNSEEDTEVSEESGEIIYHYFDSVGSIIGFDSSVYIADGSSVYKYSTQNFSLSKTTFNTSQAINKMVVYGDYIYVLEGTDNTFSAYSSSSSISITITFDTAPLSGYSDITYYNNQILVSQGQEIYAFSSTDFILESTISIGKNIVAIEGGEELYVATSNDYNTSYTDIYCAQTSGNLTEFQTKIASFKDFTFDQDNTSLCVLTENYLYNYNARVGTYEQTSSSADEGANLICAQNSSFYTFNEDKSISKIDSTLEAQSSIICSASDAYGFYNSPLDTASRLGTYYVADSLNNRIAVQSNSYDGSDSTNIALSSPISVATDADGNIYTAYNKRFINIYDVNLSLLSSMEFILDNTYRTIKLVESSYTGTLYVLTTDGNLYVMDSDTDFSLVASGVESVSASLAHEYVYYVAASSTDSNKSIYMINDDTNSELSISLDDSFIDFTVDADNNFYVLSNQNEISRYELVSEDNSYTLNSSIYTLSSSINPIKIAISAISSTLAGSDIQVNYRDIFVVDEAAHTVDSVSSSEFNVTIDTEDIRPSADSSLLDDYLYSANSESFIYYVANTNGAMIYTNCSDIYPVTATTDESGDEEPVILPYGFYCIVPYIDTESGFSLVYADNTMYDSQNEMLIGYIRNSYLSSAVNYSDPTLDECTVSYTGAAIHTYPSTQAPKFDDYDNLESGLSLSLAPFTHYKDSSGTLTYGYVDNLNICWYKVIFEDGGKTYTGYVKSDFLTFTTYETVDIQPKTNAVIVSNTDDETEGAYVYYINDDGEYVIDDNFNLIAVGKEVEVIGVYDSSSLYTQIKYVSEYGTVEVYVLTTNVEYTGIDLLQVVAIVIILLSLIMLGVIITRHIKNKRSLHSDSED